MSISVEFVKPTPELVAHVADNMRQADCEEVWASSHQTPHQALEKSLAVSDFSSVAVVDGVPIAVFGLTVYNVLTSTGIPWLLGTNDIDKHFRMFIRNAFKLVMEMNRICDNLVNHVHAKNVRSVRLLKAVGFAIDEPKPFGVEKELFHRFYIGECNV